MANKILAQLMTIGFGLTCVVAGCLAVLQAFGYVRLPGSDLPAMPRTAQIFIALITVAMGVLVLGMGMPGFPGKQMSMETTLLATFTLVMAYSTWIVLGDSGPIENYFGGPTDRRLFTITVVLFDVATAAAWWQRFRRPAGSNPR